MSTLTSLDLKTLGSQLILYFNPPDTDASQHFWNRMSTWRVECGISLGHLTLLSSYLYILLGVGKSCCHQIFSKSARYWGPVYTMNHEVGPWKTAIFHSSIWWSNFHGPISLKNQFIKPLGPSLGVIECGPKRNEHASKNECVDFCKYMPKKGNFETKKNQIWPFSCLLLSLPVFTSPKNKNKKDE